MGKNLLKNFLVLLAVVFSGFGTLFAQLTATCPKPVDIRLVGASQTTATLGWSLSDDNLGNPTKYYLTLLQGEVVIHQSLLFSDEAGAREYQISGLTANTEYRAFLQSDCTDETKGKSEVSDQFVFRTLCDYQAVPFTNDFESKDNPLPCWMTDYTGHKDKVNSKVYYGSATTGGQSAYLYATSRQQAYIVTPQLNFAANNMEVSFFYYSTANVRFSAGLISDPYDVSTYVPMFNDSVVNTKQWVEVRFNTAKFADAAEGKAIAIMIPSGTSCQLYIDNFSVREKPLCSRIERLNVDRIDSTSVVISWVDYENTGSYEVQLGENPAVAVSENPYTITGLDKNTNYSVKVRNVCAGGNSEWSSTVDFTTRCGISNAVEFIEDFEASDVLPACWFQTKTLGNGTWSVSKSEHFSGVKSVSFNRDDYKDARSLLVLQPIHIDAAGKYDLSFQMYRQWEGYESNWGKKEGEGVRVYVSNSPDIKDASAVELGMIHNHLSLDPIEKKIDGFYHYEFNIPLNGTVYVIFEGINRGGFKTYLDDIKVYEAPKCRPVQNIRIAKADLRSIDITWDNHPASDASKYKVEVTTVPASSATVTMPVDVNTNSYTITGLEPATTYTITARVATNCDADGVSEYTEQKLVFATLCEPTSKFPIAESFDLEMFPPACWTVKQTVKGTGTDEDLGDKGWSWSNAEDWDDHVNSGAGAAKLNICRKGTHTNLVSPPFDCGDIEKSFIVSLFMFRDHYGNAEGDGVRIWANSTPDTVNASLLKFIHSDSDLDPAEDWVAEEWDEYAWCKYEYEFTGKGTMYIIFEGLNADDDSRQESYLDDIRIYPKPDCDFLDIAKFSVDSIKADAVRINNSDAAVTDWSVSYGEKGFDPNAGTIVRASGASVALTGLETDTEYEFYVRLHCKGGSAYGLWSEKSATFKTDCRACIVTMEQPFFEGFEQMIHEEPLSGCYTTSADGTCDFSIYAAEADAYERTNVLMVNQSRGNQAWAFRTFELKAGVNYSVGMAARPIEYGEPGNVSVIFGVGNTPSYDSVNVIARYSIINATEWGYYRGYFTVPVDGQYAVGYGLMFNYTEQTLVDSLTLTEAGCIPPTDININPATLTYNSAEILFNSSATEWELKVSTVEFDPELGAGDVFSGKIQKKSHILKDLVPNSRYFYSLRSFCDGVPSDWSALNSFWTLCDVPTIPWIEKFEDPEGTMLNCWNFMAQDKWGDVKFGVNNKFSRSGLSFVLSETTAISPEFDVESLAGYELSGWVLQDGYGNGVFTIGVLNSLDPEEFEATYMPLATVTVPEGKTWYDFSVRFDSIANKDLVDSYGNPFDKAKCFVINYSGNYHYLYFDDMMLEPATGCAKIQEPVISDEASFGCTLDWKAGGSETEWQVLIHNDGKLVSDTVVAEHPLVIDYLKPLTEYELYVRSICGAGDTSGMRYVGLFSTTCASYPMPYDNSFDSEVLTCWEPGFAIPTDRNSTWRIDQNRLRPNTSYSGDMTSMFSPYILFEEGDNISVSLDLNFEAGDSLGIYLLENDGLPVERFTTPIAVVKTLGVQHLTYDITNLLSGNYNEFRIALAAWNNKKEFTAYIDNFTIERILPCSRPVTITINSIGVNDVDITFTDTTSATSWQYVIVPMGDDVAKAAPKDVTSKSFKAEGLVGQTQYDVYIRTVCGLTYSDWRGPHTFITACDPMPMPYVQGFEDVNNPADLELMCYHIANNGDAPVLRIGGSYEAAGESKKCLYFETKYFNKDNGEAPYTMLVLPKFERSVDELRMKFDFKSNANDGSCILGVIKDPANLASFMPVVSFNAASDYEQKSITFENVNQDWLNGYIAFKVQNGSSFRNVLIDNINILPIDFCDVPHSLSMTKFGETFASFVWTNANGVTDAEYAVETIDGDSVQTGSATTSVDITGLTAGTAYRFKVRSKCTDVKTSEWVNIDFTTLHTVPSFPYATGFETSDDNDKWVIVNGTQANKFIIGADATAINEGSGALYVSNDGTTNSYDVNTPSVVYAYRSMTFTKGQYLISYDWKGVGDYSNDFGRVFLAPIDMQPVAGRVLYAETGFGWNGNVDVDDDEKMSKLIWLDGNMRLKREFQWKQRMAEVTIDADTTVNFVVEWRNDRRGGAQPPFAFDNLMIEKISCPTLENLTIVSLSDESMSATCKNIHPADSVIYAVSRSNKVESAFLMDTIKGTNIVLAKLAPATEYYLFARTKCDSIRNSSWVSLKFTTMNEAATVPYTQGFEADEENELWQVIKRNADVNYFIIGTDQHSAKNDTKSLYITTDGSTYGYNGGVASKSYAYRVIDMPKGVYEISYDWKCKGDINGENYKDYARVFLAPSDVMVVPGADLFSESSLVSGAIALDDNAMINQTDWKRTSKQILIKEGGRYKFVAAWTNDANSKFTPLALDSIVITKLPCAVVEDIELTNVGTDFADISFFNVNDCDVVYACAKGVSNVTDIPEAKYDTISTSAINLTNLSPDSRYKLFIKALCSESDQSDWVEYVFYTQCTPDVVNETSSYTSSFEELAGLAGLDNCWYESSESANMWVANSINKTENRSPRTGKMNIVLKGSYSDNLKPHYATRRFTLKGGKYYEVSLWVIKSDVNRASYVELIEGGVDNAIVLADMYATDLTYSNLLGYFYAPEDGDYDLGFRVTSSSDFTSIDDYSVKMLPFEKPRNLEVTNITKNSADFSWVVNADSSHFELLYRGQAVMDTTLAGTSLTVGNLTAATNYTVNVYGINVDNSKTETATTTFFTDCGISQLPFMESFQTTYSTELPACWDNFSGTLLTDDNYNWNVFTDGESKYARIVTSGAYGNAELRTPVFKVDADDYALTFRYRNTSDVELALNISADGGNTFEALTKSLGKSDWDLKVFDLKQYKGSNIVIAFAIKSEAKGTGLAISLDDVRIARYGGEKQITDTHCSGMDYIKNGFSILKSDIKVGTNTFTKLVMADLNDAASNVVDTLKVLTLNVNATKEHHIYKTICEGDVYNEAPFEGEHAKSETGNYVISYDGNNGCDSNVILHLTVLPKMYYISKTICEGDIEEFGDMKCDTTGTYVVYGKNHLGCDSNVTLRLEVLPTYYKSDMYVCEGSSYDWKEAGQVLTETGVYSHVFKNYLDCDSIVEINFVVIPTKVSLTQHICSGSSIIFGDGNDAEEISKAGTYTKSFKNSLGCDSIVELRVIVDDPIEKVFEDYSCQDYAYINYGFNIPVITQDTVLKRTIKNGDGCDSTVIVNVDFIPTIITDSIASINRGEEFEFCGNKYTEPGTYRCELRSADGCDSVIVLTLTVKNSIDNIMALPLVVAPNPVRGGESTFINREWTAEEQDGLKVEILNSVGQIIAVDAPTYYPIEVNSIEVSGVYYIRVTSGTGEVYIGKLIVK